MNSFKHIYNTVIVIMNAFHPEKSSNGVYKKRWNWLCFIKRNDDFKGQLKLDILVLSTQNILVELRTFCCYSFFTHGRGGGDARKVTTIQFFDKKGPRVYKIWPWFNIRTLPQEKGLKKMNEENTKSHCMNKVEIDTLMNILVRIYFIVYL